MEYTCHLYSGLAADNIRWLDLGHKLAKILRPLNQRNFGTVHFRPTNLGKRAVHLQLVLRAGPHDSSVLVLSGKRRQKAE